MGKWQSFKTKAILPIPPPSRLLTLGSSKSWLRGSQDFIMVTCVFVLGDLCSKREDDGTRYCASSFMQHELCMYVPMYESPFSMILPVCTVRGAMYRLLLRCLLNVHYHCSDMIKIPFKYEDTLVINR